ncbi:MAG: acetylesterase, partial [Planctomycetota bacterium]
AAGTMLGRLAAEKSKNDPRGMEQRYLSFALFNRRGGLLGRSLDGVDRELLVKSVRAGLQNEDGRARGSFGSVYKNLSFEELKPLLPAIHEAIITPAPSGIMFADTIRTSGLELFAKHRVDEGIELLVDYARNQKQHASEHRIVKVMDMLKSYGAHAKRVIPRLERVASYFENEERDFPRRLSRQKAKVVRQTIREIETSTEEPKLIRLRK